jgi:hypothetical protein
MLDAVDGAGGEFAGASGVSTRRGPAGRGSGGGFSGGSMTERGALCDEANRDERAGAVRAPTEDTDREDSGGEEGASLGTTVVVNVVAGNGPLVPMAGAGDSRRAGDSPCAVPRPVAVDEEPRGCDQTVADRTAGCAVGAGDSTAINAATTANPTTSAATLYNARLATDIVRRTGGAT